MFFPSSPKTKCQTRSVHSNCGSYVISNFSPSRYLRILQMRFPYFHPPSFHTPSFHTPSHRHRVCSSKIRGEEEIYMSLKKKSALLNGVVTFFRPPRTFAPVVSSDRTGDTAAAPRRRELVIHTVLLLRSRWYVE